MKKLIFTVLMVLTVSMGMAQSSVRDAIEGYLKQEGYVPSIDSDGDILFKIEGKAYYISVDYEEDESLYYIRLTKYIYSDDVSMDKALNCCNEVNLNYKLVKCSAMTHPQEEGRIDYTITGPCFVSSAQEFIQLYPRILSCVNTGQEELIDELYD